MEEAAPFLHPMDYPTPLQLEPKFWSVLPYTSRGLSVGNTLSITPHGSRCYSGPRFTKEPINLYLLSAFHPAFVDGPQRVPKNLDTL